MKIAVIGPGAMGYGIASSLLRAGLEVRGFDVSDEVRARFVADGGDAKSNGDQSSSSGYDTSKVYANTTAHQSNYLKADMHQEVAAGIGGDGGNDNLGMGGDVDVHIDTF
jgi:3-hydroxyacyl-CoA dehydrogenase